MSEIRVLHVVPKLSRGGIETLLRNVHRQIDKTKIQFDYLIQSNEKGDYDEEVVSFGGRVFYLKRLSPRYFFFDYQKDLKHFFESHRDEYKIVHSHIDTLSALPLKAASNARYPIRIAHSHNTAISDTGFKKIVKNFYKQKITKFSTHNFACSKMAGEFCFGNSEFRVITNGIETKNFFYNEGARKAIREKLFIDDETIVFISVAAFRQQKNHSFLIDMFAMLQYFFPSSKLLLLGDGELRPTIEEKIKTLGLDDACILIGQTPATSDYLSAADVFLLPSLFEGLPISAIEAQSAGLPVFASDTITDEANLGHKYFPLPLRDGPSACGKFIATALQKLACHTALSARDLNRHRTPPEKIATFDLAKTIKQLEDFYLGFSI